MSINAAEKKKPVRGPKGFRPLTPNMTIRIDNRLKRARREINEETGVTYWAMPDAGYLGLMMAWM